MPAYSCWSCGKKKGDFVNGKALVLHKVLKEILPDAQRLTGCNRVGHQITTSSYLCCSHFAPHTKERWRVSTFPGFATEGFHVPATARSKTVRKAPAVRQDPPPARKSVKEVLKDRIRELESDNKKLQAELNAIRQGPAPRPSASIVIVLASDDVAAKWCGTQTAALHRKLLDELTPFVKAHKHRLYSVPKLLEVVLYYLAQGPSLSELATATLYSDWSAVGKMVWGVLEQLQVWADKNIYFLDIKDWIEDSAKPHSHKAYENILFYMVDGTVVETTNTSDIPMARSLHNTKHAIPAYVFFIAVSPRGRIMFVSDIRTGNTHDKTHYNSSNVNEIISNKYGDLNNLVYQNKKYTIAMGGDKAYVNPIVPDGVHVYVTKSAEETLKADAIADQEQAKAPGQKRKKREEPVLKKKPKKKDANPNNHLDPNIAVHRAVVERMFRRMKEWNILKNRRIVNSGELNLVVRFIAAIENWFVINNNIVQV